MTEYQPYLQNGKACKSAFAGVASYCSSCTTGHTAYCTDHFTWQQLTAVFNNVWMQKLINILQLLFAKTLSIILHHSDIVASHTGNIFLMNTKFYGTVYTTTMTFI